MNRFLPVYCGHVRILLVKWEFFGLEYRSSEVPNVKKRPTAPMDLGCYQMEHFAENHSISYLNGATVSKFHDTVLNDSGNPGVECSYHLPVLVMLKRYNVPKYFA